MSKNIIEYHVSLIGLIGLLSTDLTVHAQAPNDQFVNRKMLIGTDVHEQASNANATYESGLEPDHGRYVGVAWLGKTLWWSWTAPGTGVVSVDTLGSSFDTLLAMYIGSSISSLTTVAANDNADDSTSRSRVVIPVTKGRIYQIVVDGTSSTRTTGDVLLNLKYSEDPFVGALNITEPAAVENDLFANRILLNGTNVSAIGYNVGANYEGGNEPVHSRFTGTGVDWLAKTVWWAWRAPANGVATITTAGSTTSTGLPLDTLLAVYIGSRIDGLKTVLANDNADEATKTSAIRIPVTAGRIYQIVVDGNAAARQSGNVILNITFHQDPDIAGLSLPTPASVENDLFANRIPLRGRRVSAIGYTTEANYEGGNERPHLSNWLGKTIWWSWTSESSDEVLMDTRLSEFDTILAVYRGTTLQTLTRIAANDNESSADRSSLVRFSPIPGEVYHVVVDGNADTRGSGVAVLNITQDGRPSPNQLRIARAIEVEFGTVPGLLYRLQRSQNFVDWQFDIGEPRLGTGETTRWLISTEGRGHEFYRLFPIAALGASN